VQCVADLHGQNGDPQVWKAFLAWTEALPSDDFPRSQQLLVEYRSKLIRDGWSREDAEQAVLQVQQTLRSAAGAQSLERIAYNKRYTATTPTFNEQPNKFLMEVVAALKPGNALDVSMGEGRNAIFLASRGWAVTGFDIAEQGLAKARAKASTLGLELNAVRASAAEFDWGTNRWDLIVRTYAVDGPVERALKPGGVLVVETFINESKRGANVNDADSPGPNGLLRSYPSLRILRYEEVSAKPDWGTRPEALIARMVARKEH
jgi:2-polyprenyl-3-methyl-5-hydroxy-6-metoxy-1,4-benzoquinol methylase